MIVNYDGWFIKITSHLVLDYILIDTWFTHSHKNAHALQVTSGRLSLDVAENGRHLIVNKSLIYNMLCEI